jgi:hypothetical protein
VEFQSTFLVIPSEKKLALSEVEESLAVLGAISRKKSQRCFAKPVLSKAEGLNMTTPFMFRPV